MRYKSQITGLPPYKSARLTAKQQGDVIKLSSNENPLGPSPLALEAIQASLAELHRYPDAGATALRYALAASTDLPPEAVICGNGSDELVLLLCLAFLEPGDQVVFAEGTFISYLLRTLEMGGQPVRVPLVEYAHDLDALAAAITPQTRMVFVCNPNNPTGTSVGAAAVQRLLDRLPPDVLLVMDEAYCEFVSRPDYPDLLPELRAGRKNLILLRTFAKIHGLAGLRLGYGFAHPELIAYLDRARPTFNVNSVAQAAGIAALRDHDHLDRSRAHADAERAFFKAELARLGLVAIPSETNFVAFAVGDDATVASMLFAEGFTVNPLSGWGLPGLIRVSFGTREQNVRFVAALAKVLER